jgi:hypothetical protein
MIYPTRETLTREELKQLGVKKDDNVGAERTGEFRPPKAGEWFLSGAIVGAYRAPNDLPTAYYIARLVRT